MGAALMYALSIAILRTRTLPVFFAKEIRMKVKGQKQAPVSSAPGR